MEIDKFYHFVAGAIVSLSIAPHSIMFSIAAVVLVAVGKEVFDKVSRKGNCELLDILYTVAGGLFVLIPYFIFN